MPVDDIERENYEHLEQMLESGGPLLREYYQRILSEVVTEPWKASIDEMNCAYEKALEKRYMSGYEKFQNVVSSVEGGYNG